MPGNARRHGRRLRRDNGRLCSRRAGCGSAGQATLLLPPSFLELDLADEVSDLLAELESELVVLLEELSELDELLAASFAGVVEEDLLPDRLSVL